MTILEAWFFLVLMGGSGKAAVVAGPFYTQPACEEIRRQADKLIYGSGTTNCWRGPVVVSK